MKKAVALFLALILSLSLCAALAESAGEIPGTEDMPFAGLRFVPPESWRNIKGLTLTDGAVEITDGIWYAYWGYFAMTEEEFRAVLDDPEAPAADRAILLFHVFSIGDGLSFADFNTMIGNSIPEDAVREIGSAGDTSFYLYMDEPDQDFVGIIGPGYAEEYLALAGGADDVAAAFTCYEPQPKPDPNAGAVGAKFEFTARDLDGNTVSSADLFAQNEFTMINIWATWCGPCVGELPELQQLHTRMQDQKCGIIGMLTDEDLDSARRLIAENGISYPVVMVPAELYSIINLEAFPTSLFVDKDGVIVASPIVGAYVNQYESTLESLLQK